MSRRPRRHEEHVNHESWAIPYGDLITLLLAFFVVMYAISSVNAGKYRVLSDSLYTAFRGTPRTLAPALNSTSVRVAVTIRRMKSRMLSSTNTWCTRACSAATSERDATDFSSIESYPVRELRRISISSACCGYPIRRRIRNRSIWLSGRGKVPS